MPYTIEDPQESVGRYTIEDAPQKIGKAAQEDFLRSEMQNANWGTRNIAGFGTALSNLWEGAKQLVGQANPEQMAANRVMEQEAPVGAIAGNVATTAIPFAAIGNSVKGAAALGGALGALKPIEGEQTFSNIASGKLKSAAVDAALAGVGQRVANVAGEYVTDKLGKLALQRAQNAPRTQTLNDALDAGLVVPPSDVAPTVANTVKESFAGKAALGQQASNQNAPMIDNLARKAIGLPNDAELSPAVLKSVREQAYQAGYKPITDLQQIVEDPAFLQNVAKLSPKSSGGAVKSAAQGEIDDMIGALSSQKAWTGEQLMMDIRALREQAKANFRGGAPETALAKAQTKAAELLEGLAERNVIQQGGSPGAIQAMRDARKLIAKTHTVEDALVEGGGTIDARKLARMVQNGQPMTDELGVIARFANNYKRAVQPTQQIGGPGVSKLDAVMSTGAGGAGFAMGGPAGAVAGAAAPFVVPRVARAALLSKPSQNALRDIYRLGLPMRVANRLLQYSPVGFTVLGNEALSK